MDIIVRNKRDDSGTTAKPPSAGPTPLMIGVWSVVAIICILIFAAAIYIVCQRCFKKKPADLSQSVDTDMSMQPRSNRKKETGGVDDMQAMQHDLQRQALKKQNLDIEDIVKMQTGKSRKSKK